jgi:PAS domain S-box-containing protein
VGIFWGEVGAGTQIPFAGQRLTYTDSACAADTPRRRRRRIRRMWRAFRRLFDSTRRRLETRLQLAMSAGRMAAWETDLRTGERWWSPEMYALHGLPADQGIPADYDAVVHGEDRERVRAELESARQSCADYTIQYRVTWPDGSVHWIEGAGRTSCDEAGHPELMVGVCTNIDARKEQENNLAFLAEASAELAALSDYSATLQRIARLAVPHFADWCAVDMLDAAGALHRVAVAHVDPDRVRLAHELYERHPPDPADNGGTWRVIRSKRPAIVPVITDEMLAAVVPDPDYLRALRSLGLHSYMAVPLLARDKVLGVISFFTSESRREFTGRDLTNACDLAARAAVAIRNAELMDTLREADAAKDVFLATLAHELRNPIAPIANTLALLTRSSDPAALLAQSVPVMQRQMAQLTRLVDDLLDLARINSGKIELRRDVLELREVVRTAIETSQPMIDRCGHSLVVELPGEPVFVDGDPVRLAQVFSNLLNNAAKYTPDGGRIALRMEAVGDHVQICVSDTGIGIAPELLRRVFDLFAQASHPAGAEPHGLGIGLYLVRGLVQMHGGTIKAESAGLGKGSSFTIGLPRVTAPAATTRAPSGTAGVVQKKVLVVDDNRDAAETLAQLLEVLGHSPATAHDGESALGMLREFAPDVVLLDIGLPGLDGYEVARRIRASGDTGTRLVALTGWGQPEDKRKAADAGFDAHWTKPVNPEDLEKI